MYVSFYENVYKTSGIPVELTGILKAIKNGKWKDKVELYRNTGEGKETSPAVTVSGKFENARKASQLTDHSGFIAMDFDDIDDIEHLENELRTDKYTYSLFRSISGNGLCAIVKIDGKKHKDAFKSLEAYYLKHYSVGIDPSCKDVSRLRIISYDPNLYLNPESEKFENYLPKKKGRKPKIKPTFSTDDDVEYVIKQIEAKRIDITSNYSEWVELAFALYSEYGESGEDYFHRISQFHPDYDERKTSIKYKSARGGGGVSINTFFHYAKKNGLDIVTPKTRTIQRAATYARKGGRKPEDVLKQLEEVDSIPKDKAKPVVDAIYNSKEVPDLDDDDDLVGQVEDFLRRERQIKYNEVTLKYEEKGIPLIDRDMNSVYLDAKKIIPKVNKDLVFSVIDSDRTPKINPLKSFFKRNSHRDPKSAIKELAESIDTPTGLTQDNFCPNFTEMFFRKWLIGSVAMWHGKHSPLMFVLAGNKQNTGKCLAKGTLVMMSDFTKKKVEDIRKGDSLMGVNGKSTRVVSTCQGTEMMYKVVQKKGVNYTVNESHILSLKNRHTDEILNVPVRDYIKWGDGKKSKYYGWKTTYKNETDSQLKIDPYFLGLWIGDGCSQLTGPVRIENCDNEIIDYLHNYAKSIGKVVSVYEQKKSRSNSYAIVNEGGRGFGRKSNNWKSNFRDYGLHNGKRIPHEYKTASTQQRLELLAGLIDADGHLSGYTYDIIQKNKLIADDLADVVRSLGMRCTMCQKIVNGDTYWRMNIGGDISQIPVKIKRKKYAQKSKYNFLRTSINVEPIGVDKYYGFTVTGDRLFCLEDFTVTHNTHFFRYLLPDELQSYYAEAELTGDKDENLLMCSKALLMNDEMSNKSKKDITVMKKLCSVQWFNLRRPYGKSNEDIRRIATLAGTSNNIEILSDPTGNRRIIPIEVNSIDHDKYNNVDKTDLWMEAYHGFMGGEAYQLNQDDIKLLNDNTNEFEEPSPEAELIMKFFRKPLKDDPMPKYMTNTEIKSYCEMRTNQRLSNRKLGLEMKRLGYEQEVKKVNGSSKRVYLVETTEEKI